MHLVCGREEAEDIVQDVFAKLWLRWEAGEQVDSQKDYLFISVRNSCISYLRNKKYLGGELPELPTEEEITSHLIEEETNRLLLEAIAQLPERTAEVIRLGLQGKKMKEIAQCMGISINTVKTLKYDGVRTLKIMLQSLYPLILATCPAFRVFVESID